MAEEYKRKWHEQYDPEADDRQYFGTRVIDYIDKQGGEALKNWWEDERQLEGWEYLNPVSHATFLATRGVETAGKVITAIPGAKPVFRTLAEGQDIAAGTVGDLVGKAGIDPRVGGWSTRIATDIALGKGIGRAAKATGVTTKVAKGATRVKRAANLTAKEAAERIKARRAKKWTRSGDTGTPVDRSDPWKADDLTGPKKTYTRITNPQVTIPIQREVDPWNLPPKSEILTEAERVRKVLGNDLLLKIEKGGRRRGRLPRPELERKKILEDTNLYPSIEQLDQAVMGSAAEIAAWNRGERWQYNRELVEGVSDDLVKQLQKELGGTDGQRDSFQLIQRATKSKLKTHLKKLNDKLQFDFLEFANLATMEGERLGRRLDPEDVYKLAVAMAKNPKLARTYDLGHNVSAKNTARRTRKGKLTSADYASNMQMEISKSIKDLIFREDNRGSIVPKPSEPMITSGDKSINNVLRVVEKGNIARGAREDLPLIVQHMMGVSPNIETEYMRYINPDIDTLVRDIIPYEDHEKFIKFLRDGIRKWQGRGKKRIIGKQQLDQYPQKLRELVDEYLTIQEGRPYQVLSEDVELMKKIKNWRNK